MHKARKLEVMKRIGLKIAILAIVAAAAPAWAGDGGSGVVRNCTWCHGTGAQGYMVAPRLAGQRPAYIENQIRNFRDHTRNNPFSKQYMWNAVAFVGPNASHDLANYFATISPKPANDGNRDLAAKGREIFINGIPEANVVSCFACHGPNAEGVRNIPRLGGLAYFYLKGRLQQWNQGYHASTAAPMPKVASYLSPDVIEALASYLSFVK
jgi:cytochrome c553